MAIRTKAAVWFQEVGKDDVAFVGGKGANLCELTRGGIPVPPGFIVTADTYFQFLDESCLRPVLEEMLQDLDLNDNA